MLLGRRSDNHKWGYSGGAVEIDERAEDCARRELCFFACDEIDLSEISPPIREVVKQYIQKQKKNKKEKLL